MGGQSRVVSLSSSFLPRPQGNMFRLACNCQLLWTVEQIASCCTTELLSALTVVHSTVSITHCKCTESNVTRKIVYRDFIPRNMYKYGWTCISTLRHCIVRTKRYCHYDQLTTINMTIRNCGLFHQRVQMEDYQGFLCEIFITNAE